MEKLLDGVKGLWKSLRTKRSGRRNSKKPISRKRKTQAGRGRQRRLLWLAVLVFVLAGVSWLIYNLRFSDAAKARREARQQEREAEEKKRQTKVASSQAEAEKKAAMYDFDGAIEVLKKSAIENKENADELIDRYERQKKVLRKVELSEVTMISVRTLIAKPELTWELEGDNLPRRSDYNQSRLTVEEFGKILQELYDRDYVLVSPHNLATLAEGEKGGEEERTLERHFLYLPSGKKPLILAQDDLSYPEDFEGHGFASRLLLTDEGKVKAEYRNAEGQSQVGNYDLVPIVDDFVEKHPDFSYRGAKGILGISGGHGVMGYDPAKEGREAKKLASALKEGGWDLASATYGYISYNQGVKIVKEDLKAWEDRVMPITGKTDILLLPFGADIGNWSEYSQENKVYRLLKDKGFAFFCTSMDSSGRWQQVTASYLRLSCLYLDGYSLYQNKKGRSSSLADFLDAGSILSEDRPFGGLAEDEESSNEDDKGEDEDGDG